MIEFSTDLTEARVFSACGIALAWVAMSAWFLWPRRSQAAASQRSDADDQILVAFASQTGFASEIAARTAQSLQSSGAAVRLAALSELGESPLLGVKRALFVASTTGEGDAPDSAASFVRAIAEAEDASSRSLGELRYGVLALGDRAYDNFCAFGHRLDGWLHQRKASRVFDVIEVDNGDERALRRWRDQLGAFSATSDLPAWETPRYERWRLAQRRLLNPGSAGDPCFHIALQPDENAERTWRAGDIVEIDPRNSTWNVNPSSEEQVSGANSGSSLASRVLPRREYSIASTPADGVVELLVRQMRQPNGEPGLGSGWLTQEARPGDVIAARIRSNPNFHAPDQDRPLILVGNGTGLAGLRGLLKERVAMGRRRNWLIFGERNAACDAFHRDELERWRRESGLRVDLVFSRDQTERRYVQHRLLECAEDIRAWIDEGAAVYVCGSLEGMAPGVHEALARILGAAALDNLVETGRYRRDVY